MSATESGLRVARRAAVVALLRFIVAVIIYGAAAVVYRDGFGWTGRPGVAAVVVATAVVALALWQLHEPMGRVADRLVFGSGASNQRVVRGLLHRMASTVSVDEVAPRLAETVGRRIGGSRAEVRVLLADGQKWARVWPPDASGAGPSLTVGVHHSGDPVGEIEVVGADTGPAERRLLDQLAAPAGLALSTVRLTVELRRRIAELDRINTALRASSERMLTAQQDEQRRLEREVDDHVMTHVNNAWHCLAPDPHLLDSAAEQCERALDELRNIARGIYPPMLADAGLLVAVEGWLDRAQLHAELSATELRALPASAELEACLYFCAATALEALDGAGRKQLSMRVEESATEVVLALVSSGGGAVNADALAAVRDRIEAFDGTLETTPEAIVCTAPLRRPAAALA